MRYKRGWVPPPVVPPPSSPPQPTEKQIARAKDLVGCFTTGMMFLPCRLGLGLIIFAIGLFTFLERMNWIPDINWLLPSFCMSWGIDIFLRSFFWQVTDSRSTNSDEDEDDDDDSD